MREPADDAYANDNTEGTPGVVADEETMEIRMPTEGCRCVREEVEWSCQRLHFQLRLTPGDAETPVMMMLRLYMMFR